jgi:hypothetical protein
MSLADRPLTREIDVATQMTNKQGVKIHKTLSVKIASMDLARKRRTLDRHDESACGNQVYREAS